MHKIESLEEHINKVGKPKKIITDNEFKSANILEFLREQGIEIHFTRPNSHTGNSDVERLHSTILEILHTIKDREISTHTKLFRAFKKYNNRFHNTLGTSPNKTDTIDKKVLIKRIQEIKQMRLDKINRNRENYIETRSEGYVRNYKHVRHKDEPYFRKIKLKNVHSSNIKREPKIPGLDVNTSNTDSHTHINGNTYSSADSN